MPVLPPALLEPPTARQKFPPGAHATETSQYALSDPLASEMSRHSRPSQDIMRVPSTPPIPIATQSAGPAQETLLASNPPTIGCNDAELPWRMIASDRPAASKPTSMHCGSSTDQHPNACMPNVVVGSLTPSACQRRHSGRHVSIIGRSAEVPNRTTTQNSCPRATSHVSLKGPLGKGTLLHCSRGHTMDTPGEYLPGTSRVPKSTHERTFQQKMLSHSWSTKRGPKSCQLDPFQ